MLKGRVKPAKADSEIEPEDRASSAAAETAKRKRTPPEQVRTERSPLPKNPSPIEGGKQQTLEVDERPIDIHKLSKDLDYVFLAITYKLLNIANTNPYLMAVKPTRISDAMEVAYQMCLNIIENANGAIEGTDSADSRLFLEQIKYYHEKMKEVSYFSKKLQEGPDKYNGESLLLQQFIKATRNVISSSEQVQGKRDVEPFNEEAFIELSQAIHDLQLDVRKSVLNRNLLVVYQSLVLSLLRDHRKNIVELHPEEIADNPSLVQHCIDLNIKPLEVMTYESLQKLLRSAEDAEQYESNPRFLHLIQGFEEAASLLLEEARQSPGYREDTPLSRAEFFHLLISCPVEETYSNPVNERAPQRRTSELFDTVRTFSPFLNRYRQVATEALQVEQEQRMSALTEQLGDDLRLRKEDCKQNIPRK
ncbi:MAG: hypothetical protein CMF48_02680 [Legionellales bacterium]|nr:hypothetical protein [Legionellales bacterium]